MVGEEYNFHQNETKNKITCSSLHETCNDIDMIYISGKRCLSLPSWNFTNTSRDVTLRTLELAMYTRTRQLNKKYRTISGNGHHTNFHHSLVNQVTWRHFYAWIYIMFLLYRNKNLFRNWTSLIKRLLSVMYPVTRRGVMAASSWLRDCRDG